MSYSSTSLKKVVLLGDGGVGKSALCISLCQNYFVSNYDPTIENNYRKAVEDPTNGVVHMIDILDTAGQEDYAVMRDQYISSGDGFLLVYSVAARSTLQTVSLLYKRILRVRDVDHYPVVILGNKCDMPPERRELSKEDGEAVAREFNAGFFETSAKDHINVEQSFVAIARAIDKARGVVPKPVPATPKNGTNGVLLTNGRRGSSNKQKVCLLL